MTCGYYSHPDCGLHDSGPGHPERAARNRAIHDRFTADGLFDWLNVRTPQALPLEATCRTHRREHVSAIARAIPSYGTSSLDPDTVIGPHSLDAALLAAGAAVQATDAVCGQDGIQRAFCNIRPPGHHAEPDRAMGFCLFNNVALAAYRALDAHGMERVAVLDFDVHHGNGTEALVRGDRRILYASSFQYPLFPFPDLAGEPDHILKTPLVSGTASAGFRAAIERDWLPALRRFRPQMVLFSAGFDAHRADPLAGLELDDADFGWVTGTVLAEVQADIPVVSVLEGGYDLQALAHSAAAHVRVLAGV